MIKGLKAHSSAMGFFWIFMEILNMIRVLGLLVLLLVISACGSEKLSPEMKLVKEVEEATNQQAWNENNWKSWSFADRRHYVWDAGTGRIRLQFEEYEILFQQDSVQNGKVFYQGQALLDSTKTEILERGWAAFCNDSFWLNAPGKLRDPGVKLTRKDSASIKRLEVQYSSGGVTPGDSYLWYIDSDGLPYMYEMWVSNIREPGFAATWDGWKEVNKALVSTMHEMEGFTLVVDSVQLGRSYEEIGWTHNPFQNL